jgi:hypothetical protein
MAQKFRVTLIGDETHEITTTHRDLMLTETTLVKRGLDPAGKRTPVHYITALIWACMVRLGITSSKFEEFGDMIVDFDRLNDAGEVIGADPTPPAEDIGSLSASPQSSGEVPPIG